MKRSPSSSPQPTVAHRTEPEPEPEGLLGIEASSSSPTTTETAKIPNQLPGTFEVTVELPNGREWEERVDMIIHRYDDELWMDQQEVYDKLLDSGVFQRAYEQLDSTQTYQITCYTLDGNDDDDDIELFEKSYFAKGEGEDVLHTVMDRFDLFLHIAKEYGGPIDPYKATTTDYHRTDMSVIIGIHSDQ